MDQSSNIGFEFLKVAQKSPDLLAIVTDEAVLNYEQLSNLVISVCNNMAGLGVEQNSVVSVETEDTLVAFSTLLATALLGAQWIAHRNYSMLSEYVKPTHWFQSSDVVSKHDSKFVVIDESWTPNSEATERSMYSGYVDKDTPWLFVNTSGTTGTPKLLTISQAMLFERSKAVTDDFVEGKTVFCSLFGCNAFPYITRAVASLINGCTIVSSKNFNLWDKAGVNLVYGSVTQVADTLGSLKLQSKLPEIHVSGAKLSDELALHLLESFDRVIDLYASTETNRSYKNIKTLNQSGQLETKGQALDSIVEIIDADGKLCSEGEIGVVRVKNKYLVKGYINNPEAQEKSFIDGWFYSGDFGLWGKNRQLTILGRVGDVINLGGVKVNAAEIDQVLKAASGVVDAMCFENPVKGEVSEILAFVKFQDGIDAATMAGELGSYCMEKLGELRSPSRIIEVNHIPRAHDGGAQRWICQQMYREIKSLA